MTQEHLPPESERQAQPEPTTDQCIELAAALEQRRGLQIVEDVHNLRVGGRTEQMPTAFHAGWCGACEEIEHRLRTEKWELCIAPVGLENSTGALRASSAAPIEEAMDKQLPSSWSTAARNMLAAYPAQGREQQWMADAKKLLSVALETAT